MSTTTIYTDGDSWCYEDDPNYNNGSSTRLVIRGESNHRRRSFINFDITSAPSSIISSVILYLYKNRTDSSFTGRFNRITGSWTESGITWNNQPAVTSVNQTTHAIPTALGWHNFDITNIYNDAKTAGNTCGIRIMDHNEYSDTRCEYDSREASHDPYIIITYTVPSDYYVKTGGNDALGGDSWANAWKTVNKGATTVADGKTLHIEHGTYNAEPVGNKIAPQNVGASGIEYKIHTTGGGTGTATVTVEKN